MRELVKPIFQSGPQTCGAAALAMLLQLLGKQVREDDVLRVLNLTPDRVTGINIAQIIQTASHFGVKLVPKRISATDLTVPCIAYMASGHYVVVTHVKGDSVILMDPELGVLSMHLHQFTNGWTTVVIEPEGCNGLPVKTVAESDLTHVPGALRGGLVARLVQSALPHSPAFAVMFALVMINIVVSLALPFAIMLLVDGFSKHAAVDSLAVAGGLLAAVFIQNLCLTVAGTLYSRTANAILVDLRIKLFSRIQQLSARSLQNWAPGDLLSRLIRDVNLLQSFASSTLFGAVVSCLTACLVAAILARMHWKMLLLGVSTLPAFAVVSLIFQRTLRQRSEALHNKFGLVTAHAERSLLAADSIRYLGQQGREIGSFRRTLGELYHAAVAAEIPTYVSQAITTGLSSLGPIAILWYGSMQVQSGSVTIGMVTSFSIIMGRLYQPIGQLVQHTLDFQAALTASQRYFSVLDEPRDIPEPVTPVAMINTTGAVTLNHIRFEHPGGRRLEDIHWAIPGGSFVCLVGPSGAGKSTLARLVVREYDLNDGQVLLDGCDIRQLRTETLRSLVSYIPSAPSIFEGTLLDNIHYGNPYCSLNDVQSVVDLVGLRYLVAQLREGLLTQITQNGANISGGQRQLIGIARALLRRPRVLVLDEATGNLEPEAETALYQRLREALPDATFLVVSHRPWVAELANEVGLLTDGRLESRGKHQELLGRSSMYRNLCGQKEYVQAFS